MKIKARKKGILRGEGKKYCAGFFLLFLSFLLQVAARRIPGFGEWYGTHIYPLLVCIIGSLSNLFPFSVVEIGLYFFLLLIVWIIFSSIRKFMFCRNRDGSYLDHPVKLGAYIILIVGMLAFSYTVNCGINYYRTPFSHFLALDLRPSSEEELTKLCYFLVEQVNQAIEEISGEPHFPQQARTDMKKLGEVYPQLSGYYPRPKPLLIPQILSVQSLSGIYSPFTIEANYNREMTDYNIPHTACHELSHLRGFMREEEANFIGYLACVGSDAAYSRYSGYLSGFIYASNALYRQNPKAVSEIYALLPQQALEDLHKNNEFWKRYEGPIAEVSTQVNDTYLKANSQSDGVKSYGRMVDLLLAYYRTK